MCSIGEDDFGDEGGMHAMVPDEELITKHEDDLCNKCQSPDPIYKLPFREAECKKCFLDYVRHKFRAALGSSKVLPKNARVLLVFDGSLQSVVLLDMLHHAQTQNSFKRLHCSCTVLIIDDYQVIHGKDTSHENHRMFIKDIQRFLSKYTSFESFLIPLVDEESAKKSITDLKALTENYFTNERNSTLTFLTNLNTIKSLTSRQDYLKRHRNKLIAVTAKHSKCQYAFMADISADLASDLLAAVALGRGRCASLEVALVDNRLGDGVQIVRPLSDLSVLEIELYGKAEQLEFLRGKCYGNDVGPSGSLQNLTRSFVEDLQKNYSSTISTVFRTGGKIATNTRIPLENNILKGCANELPTLYCSFCNSLLDYQDSKTLLAIEFSRIVSEYSSTPEKMDDLNEKAQQSVEGTNEGYNLRKLCHACRNILGDSSSELLLS